MSKGVEAISMNTQKLHLGCGLNTPADWINVDGSWNARLAKYPRLRRLLAKAHALPSEFSDIEWSRDIFIHDVRRPLPFCDGTFHVVYSSHMLEHLYHEEAKQLLKECYRVLCLGGVIRIVVPDLYAMVVEYMAARKGVVSSSAGSSSIPADKLNERLLFRSAVSPQGNLLYRIYSGLMDFHSHKWMYDAQSLVHWLSVAGFSNVSEMNFCKSRIEEVDVIEQAERVLNGEGVCVEGIKTG